VEIKYMREAYIHAWNYSEDLNTQCGAVLLDPTGYSVAYGTNKFPPGLDSRTLTLDRDLKLTYIEHAERAVIYRAARQGISTKDMTMVAPWASCAACARAIVLAGIKKVVAHKQAYDRTPDRWKAELDAGFKILEAGGVEYELLDAKIGYCQNLFNGAGWTP